MSDNIIVIKSKELLPLVLATRNARNKRIEKLRDEFRLAHADQIRAQRAADRDNDYNSAFRWLRKLLKKPIKYTPILEPSSAEKLLLISNKSMLDYLRAQRSAEIWGHESVSYSKKMEDIALDMIRQSDADDEIFKLMQSLVGTGPDDLYHIDVAIHAFLVNHAKMEEVANGS